MHDGATNAPATEPTIDTFRPKSWLRQRAIGCGELAYEAWRKECERAKECFDFDRVDLELCVTSVFCGPHGEDRAARFALPFVRKGFSAARELHGEPYIRVYGAGNHMIDGD
jgi:hypothetical protein